MGMKRFNKLMHNIELCLDNIKPDDPSHGVLIQDLLEVRKMYSEQHNLVKYYKKAIHLAFKKIAKKNAEISNLEQSIFDDAKKVIGIDECERKSFTVLKTWDKNDSQEDKWADIFEEDDKEIKIDNNIVYSQGSYISVLNKNLVEKTCRGLYILIPRYQLFTDLYKIHAVATNFEAIMGYPLEGKEYLVWRHIDDNPIKKGLNLFDWDYIKTKRTN